MKEISITLPAMRVSIKADVFGDWAVHRAVRNEQWEITHVPSGLAIPTWPIYPTKAEATTIARRLRDAGIAYSDGITHDMAVTDEIREVGRRVMAIVTEVCRRTDRTTHPAGTEEAE